MERREAKLKTPVSTLPKLRIRVVLDTSIAIGPGKADLLDGIAETGSIAAAGRRMKMSYKRAWQLVDALNQAFHSPLVETATGGRRGGGARLTALGSKVLGLYRAMERRAERTNARALAELRALATRAKSRPPR